MYSGFQMDTDINRQLTLQQTKQAALHALQAYDVDWHSIHFLQVSEHATFRIEIGEGEKLLLRIHPLSKVRHEIVSELEWLAYLNRKDAVVPEAVLNRDGALLTNVKTGGGQQFDATLLRWIEGERLDKGALSEENIQKLGELMANLHKASADFHPNDGFTRPSWGSQSFNRDWEHLQGHCKHFIDKEAVVLYTLAAAKVKERLDTFETNSQNYGMIHADLHLGNVVFHNGEPFPIDFGRCGFGYHLYDMAQSIMGLYPLQRKLFIEGYRKDGTMNECEISMLESFFIMSIIEAYSFHAEDERETEGLIEEQPYAQAILRAFINGEPFLFEPLDGVS